MAGNSTILLQDIVDEALTFGELAPVLATGGYSAQPALSIANDVITAMMQGGPSGQPFNWKWNRINVTPFYTISYQQDYFVPNLVSIGWIEYAWCSNINATQIPKEKKDLEVRRDLQVTYWETGYPGKICWIPNSTCQTGTWGAQPQGPTAGNPSGNTTTSGPNPSGLQNPGPGVIYTNPVGTPNQPINATTAIADTGGNLWALTTYGTCGTNNPFNAAITAVAASGGTATITAANAYVSGQSVAITNVPATLLSGTFNATFTILTASSTQFTISLAGTLSTTATTGNVQLTSIVYPSYANPNIVATTVTDGTSVWTAINPQGQGFRLNPIPPQSGITWFIQAVVQARIPIFRSLSQTLEPVPDDYVSYFKQGFFCQCYRRSPDPKVRAKFNDEWKLWMDSLDKCVQAGQRELDDFGFYPTQSVMDSGQGVYVGPAYPWPNPWGT